MRMSIPQRLLTAALLGALVASPAAAQERSWFDRLDANDDGRITWNEYRRGMQSFDNRTDRTGRFERESRTDQTGRFERRDDRDREERRRNGRGSRREYQKRLRAEFRWLDRNDDGVISRREAGIIASGRSERDRWN